MQPVCVATSLVQDNGDIMSIANPAKFAYVLCRTRRFSQMLAWYQTVFNDPIQHQNRALVYDDE